MSCDVRQTTVRRSQACMIQTTMASVRDIVGGRSASYEKELHRARQLALEEFEEGAKKVGADGLWICRV